ncbi:MAG: hypothetical protein KBC26_02575 [Candidatus Pacebacteria bacterium]|nr:hypothetical protein [Candidatus Paceibacterota bacterium]
MENDLLKKIDTFYNMKVITGIREKDLYHKACLARLDLNVSEKEISQSLLVAFKFF